MPGVKEISSAIKPIRAADGMMPLAALSHFLYNPNPQITLPGLDSFQDR